MVKDIRGLIENFNYKYRRRRLCRFIAFILSCVVFLLTVYFFITPAMALDSDEGYTLHLVDSYDYSWKLDGGYTTSYDLKIYFVDINGNDIEGHDVNIEIGPDKFEDNPYGFGYVPLKSATNNENRGQNLIDVLNLKEYITSSGEKYEFDHALVYVDGDWQKLSGEGIRWHIWCQNSSSEFETIDKNYGWRGRYGDNDVLYTITNDTMYKLVYKLVRYGSDLTVSSLGEDSGIRFGMFNYTGDNDETGINNNGIYDYFTFRDSSRVLATKINSEIDGDGFKDNRAKVLTKLDAEGYPVFDCQGKCSENPSLGYLFGSSKNPLGNTPVGVEVYNPTNTLLQKEIIDDVEYYYYDSNKNAVDYDIDNNSFLVRNYVERAYSISTYKDEGDRYEFLPFNYSTDIENLFVNTTTNLTYNYEQVDKDSWYGMTMEFDFYMPRDGMIKDKDMIFSFSGDDDVWVFIDDVLVLDLGGTHGVVDGSINFHTGEVVSYLNWNNIVGDKNITNIYQAYSDAMAIDSVKWDDSNTTFADYTKHRLKFFYLERGAAVANCKIRFNIPVLPMGSLSVQKQFDGLDRYNEDYEFILYDVTSNSVVANAEYMVGDNKFVTDHEGKFKLKNNEIAIFKLINEHKYYVEESDAGMNAVSYHCSFDGKDCPTIDKTPEFIMEPDSAYQAVFINKVKLQSLNVSKIAYNSEDDEIFNFKIYLKNEDGTLDGVLDDINSINDYELNDIDGSITFSLKNENNIVINGIPINSKVTIEELSHDGYNVVIKSGDVILADGDSYEFDMDSDKWITVYNIPGVMLPETGSDGSIFYLLMGTLFMLISGGYYCFLSKKEGG